MALVGGTNDMQVSQTVAGQQPNKLPCIHLQKYFEWFIKEIGLQEIDPTQHLS